MSFYVTLPSNSSKENTLAKFTTKLDPPIILESDEYEVGLAEVMFPFNFKRDANEHMVFKKNPQGSIAFYLGQVIFYTADELVEILNDYLKKNSYPISFYFNSNSLRWALRIDKDYSVLLRNGAHEFFGFDKFQLDASLEPHVGKKQKPYNYFDTNAIYIYSDISQYQNVGDTFAPLLRVVPITGNIKFGQNINAVFDSPHYKPVCTKFINSIEIQLTTEIGKPVKFSNWGRVIVTLHFRPKRSV